MYTLANINNPMVWVAILVVVVVLFGGQKIPELMKGIGQGKRAFEEGLRTPHRMMNCAKSRSARPKSAAVSKKRCAKANSFQETKRTCTFCTFYFALSSFSSVSA